jgi:hypothetical protein
MPSEAVQNQPEGKNKKTQGVLHRKETLGWIRREAGRGRDTDDSTLF